MYYVREQNKKIIFPYSLFQLRQDFPNVSFSGLSLVDIDQDFLKLNGIYPVKIPSLPIFNKHTKKLSELYVEKQGEMYVGKYDVLPLNVNELARVFEDEVKGIKYKRNQLLVESDWTQVEDSPVNKESWKVYRQALRDITFQDGYPFEVIWPSAPA